jgi:acyl-CoA-binding protein
MVSEEFHNSMDLALYSLFKQGIIKVDYENNKLSINLEACGDTLEEAWTNLQMKCGMEPDLDSIENPH